MPPPAESRTISRSRRRTRLRSTALPTCRDTVKPMRTGPSSARRRACTTKAPTDARKAAAAARKSVRRVNRSMVAGEMRSRTEPLAALRPPGRQHSAAAFGRHPGAKAVTALAHQFARLVGPFHGIFLRCARNSASFTASFTASFGAGWSYGAMGAAYTGALPPRQRDFAAICLRFAALFDLLDAPPQSALPAPRTLESV